MLDPDAFAREIASQLIRIGVIIGLVMVGSMGLIGGGLYYLHSHYQIEKRGE